MILDQRRATLSLPNEKDLPSSWLAKQGLKIFAVNNRVNLLPNLWCICLLHINPTVLYLDDQQVAFSIKENDKDFCFSAVYASTSFLKRRTLWQKLRELQIQFDLPWCFFGDFKSILGAHEHRGRHCPARPPIEDFQRWTDSNDLVHLPTRGASFTWSNRRGGRHHTERRLDRVVCNHKWLDLCTSVSCHTLIKNISDHFPLLLVFKTNSVGFASSFKFLKVWSLHDDCKNVIQSCWNERVVGCPMYVLNFKLKSWNSEIFGNVHGYVKEAEKELQDIQDQIQDNGHYEGLLKAETLAQKKVDEALDKHEMFWKELDYAQLQC
jgi:hypothetical protein